MNPDENLKPTLVIDKSVFQRIAELNLPDRLQIWESLGRHFTIILPFVLIDEILVNLGQPGATDPTVVNAMFQEVLRLRGHCTADEPAWVFDEVVEKNRSMQFKPVPPEFFDGMVSFSPTSSAYQSFLEDRRRDGDEAIRARISRQDELAKLRSEAILNEHWFEDQGRLYCLVGSEQIFFDRFVSPEFHSRDRNSDAWFNLIDYSLGTYMRKRYPGRAACIEKALRAITMRELFRLPCLFAITASKSFYFWAPLVRIGTMEKNSKVILGRGESRQRSNINDERYVAMALLSKSIVTLDREMAKIMVAFQKCGLWKGRVFDLSKTGTMDIRAQIRTLIESNSANGQPGNSHDAAESDSHT